MDPLENLTVFTSPNNGNRRESGTTTSDSDQVLGIDSRNTIPNNQSSSKIQDGIGFFST